MVPDGKVIVYSISATISCDMNLRFFPLDSQTCSIMFESFGFSNDDLLLRWKDGADPVQVADINLPEFVIKKHSLHDCDHEYVTGLFFARYLRCFSEMTNVDKALGVTLCSSLKPTLFVKQSRRIR